MKLFLSLAVILLSSSAFAGEYCGIANINGTKDFYYATISDGKYDAKITGETIDVNGKEKLLKDGECHCVTGQVVFQFGNYEFTSVTDVGPCHSAPK
jgi:hypothetical protein